MKQNIQGKKMWIIIQRNYDISKKYGNFCEQNLSKNYKFPYQLYWVMLDLSMFPEVAYKYFAQKLTIHIGKPWE